MFAECFHKNASILGIVVLCGSLVACDETDSMPVTTPTPPPTSTVVNASGSLVSPDDIPLGGYSLIFGGPTDLEVTTEPDGDFTVQLLPGDYSVSVEVLDISAGEFTSTLSENGSFSGLTNNVFTVTIPEDTFGSDLDDPTELPPLYVSQITPSSNSLVNVALNLGDNETLTEFRATGLGCGAIDSQIDLSSGSAQENVGSSGDCVLSGTISNADGDEKVVTAEFTVNSPVPILSGIIIPDAIFDATADLEDADGGPRISNVDYSGTLINGGTVTAFITLEDPALRDTIEEIGVQVEGFDGVFYLPASPTMDGRLAVVLALEPSFFDASPESEGPVIAYEKPDLDVKGLTPNAAKEASAEYEAAILFAQENTGSSLLNLIFQLVGQGNSIGEVSRSSVSLTEVGSGELQINVSWDTSTDVDLHVVEPGGEEIYFGNRTSSTGGTLDLDSNPACSIDGTNSENITWADPSRIPTGEFTVRVNYWQACQNQNANYTVTIRNCGETSTFIGSFSASDASGGGRGSGRVITNLNYDGCSGFRAKGRAVYADLPPSTSGFGSARNRAIRFARIEIVEASDATNVLATGTTDAAGNFDVSFDNHENTDWRVRVLAQQSDSNGRQKVVNVSNQIYSQQTEPFSGQSEREVLEIMLEAPENEAGPAFNILDVGTSGFALSKRYYNSIPSSELTWQWPPSGRESGGSFYRPSQNLIGVADNSDDQDQYDDTNLLHEFGHYFLNELSDNDSPGGAHRITDRLQPAFAFNEGFATVIGNAAINSPVYIDVKPSGTFSYSIETIPTIVPVGTGEDGNGDMTATVSEVLVSAVGWDLFDNTPTETAGSGRASDSVSNPRALFRAIRELRETSGNRGANGADLVDFLDRWSCSGGETGGTVTTGFRGVVQDLNSFPYDFMSPATEENCNDTQ